MAKRLSATEKEALRIQKEKAQKPVQRVVITIEWKKSRTWGMNPHATAEVLYQDGSWKSQEGFRCSGCGYDKESTVVADVFDTFLMYKLWQLKENVQDKELPYGINIDGNWPHYGSGIGIGCYETIAQAIGGVFTRVASGNTFDVYRYDDRGGDKMLGYIRITRKQFYAQGGFSNRRQVRISWGKRWRYYERIY